MITLHGTCPNCGHKNRICIKTYGEQIAEFEQDNQNGSFNKIIKDFSAKNIDDICQESLANRIKCENCEEDYSIEETSNWNELKGFLRKTR